MDKPRRRRFAVSARFGPRVLDDSRRIRNNYNVIITKKKKQNQIFFAREGAFIVRVVIIRICDNEYTALRHRGRSVYRVAVIVSIGQTNSCCAAGENFFSFRFRNPRRRRTRSKKKKQTTMRTCSTKAKCPPPRPARKNSINSKIRTPKGGRDRFRHDAILP